MSQAVLLMSSCNTDQLQEVSQRRIVTAFEGNKMDFITVDGALEENKELRGVLFGISEQRGKYPQVFIKDEDGSYRFIGLYDAIESLIECDELPADVVASNPNIPTFKKTFANVKRIE